MIMTQSTQVFLRISKVITLINPINQNAWVGTGSLIGLLWWGFFWFRSAL